MNNLEFVTSALAQRRALPPTPFETWVKDLVQFKIIVQKLVANNTKWAEKVGLNNQDDEITTSLSPAEAKWKKFFQSHSFDSSNEQRNLADAFSIIADMDLRRFLKFEKPPVDRFQAQIAIVPIANSNEHNYKIGEPIFCFSRGTAFLRANGTSGNSMSTDIHDYRMADEEEIISLLARLMYKSDQIIESLTINLLEN